MDRQCSDMALSTFADPARNTPPRHGHRRRLRRYIRRLQDVLKSLCCLSHEDDDMGAERMSYVIEDIDMYTYWRSQNRNPDQTLNCVMQSEVCMEKVKHEEERPPGNIVDDVSICSVEANRADVSISPEISRADVSICSADDADDEWSSSDEASSSSSVSLTSWSIADGDVFVDKRKDEYRPLVAVKQPLPTKPKSTSIREVRVLSKLEHRLAFPKLIGVIDEQQPSLVMEFVGDWQALTSSSIFYALDTFNPCLSISEWWTVARDIAKGLTRLHRIGYLHGDVHNGNIMLCRYPQSRDPLQRWQAKIIDLGFSPEAPSHSAPLNLAEGKKSMMKKCQPYKALELVINGITSGHTVATNKYAFGSVIDDVGFFRDIKVLSVMGNTVTVASTSIQNNETTWRNLARDLAL